MSTPEHEERRTFHRILFDAPATLTYGEDSCEVELFDLSLRGALLHTPANWSGSSGEMVKLDVRLSEEAHIEMQAEITHQSPERIGLRCCHIDMESISHLRRLVELNLGDQVLLERELEALG